LVIVSEAPGRTIAAGTARVLHGIRVNAPDGEPAPTERQDAGVVDFVRRSVHYPSTIVVGKSEYPGETLWCGPDLFSRSTAEGSWQQIPLGRVPPGAMPFGGPLWLLGALCSAPKDVAIVSEDQVRGVSTTHISVTLDTRETERCSPWRLGFPSRREPTDAFPAEVWLDDNGRVRRMGCDWIDASRGRLGQALHTIVAKASGRRTSWVTTEFWDFGVDVVLPKSNRSAARTCA
jgi:hypothetical protein